jgi:7-keto-8-aminopelargonate synthetase-like enzyme
VDTQELQQVALFEKCRQFTKARELQAVGLYPYFKPISESEDTVVVIDGQKRIMLGSNNYLGLTHHPKVLEAASRALDRYGSGCTGSRFLNGTLDLHEQLEGALAEFVGKEDCLVFSTRRSWTEPSSPTVIPNGSTTATWPTSSAGWTATAWGEGR